MRLIPVRSVHQIHASVWNAVDLRGPNFFSHCLPTFQEKRKYVTLLYHECVAIQALHWQSGHRQNLLLAAVWCNPVRLIMAEQPAPLAAACDEEHAITLLQKLNDLTMNEGESCCDNARCDTYHLPICGSFVIALIVAK